ncbi:NAD(P)H-dependent flavin oxidoreductase [Mesorhizobium australafricanum]|uniref:Nitronate monooxygenase family protein n=1 Tax=Mesorhizobium australafricanum TaxID=3072311 RepID=A0ABU4X5H1_9HYPH|nr:nitronate monooxygenase family protein [Mesorhizobium sp. VK3E]MDX8443582.1 nitronate monooxygenase family protein [Mesorhizobium sp. VK3E]
MFQTKLTDLLGIRHPIVCGGMFRIGRAPLAAAVSNAGGLGIITSATFPDLETFSAEVRLLRKQTDMPFGVNINLFPTARQYSPSDFLEVCIREGVPILETSGQSPEPYLERIKKAGLKIIHKVPAAQYALKAQRIGCDAVAIVGNETGGHPGTTDVSTLVMLRQAAKQMDIPVIAGGGFGDGAGLLAALSLGADGIVMGTRFLATREAGVHQAVKDWMVAAKADDTVIVQKSIGSPMRVAKNGLASRIVQMEADGATLEELLPFISGSRNPAVYFEGKLDDAIWSCGQVVGLVRDVPSCGELIDRIIAEAHAALASVNAQSISRIAPVLDKAAHG